MVKPYYEEANCRIYHGDCREVLEGLRASADYVITDPPYALGSSRQEWRVTASVGAGIHAAARAVKKGGALFCFSAASGRGLDYTLGAVGSALPLNRLLIWHKSFVRSRVAGPWRWDIVAILAFGRACFDRPQHSSLCTTSGPASVALLGETKHPAEVPLDVARWLYCPLDGEGVTVLDPFMGSGSLLLPAAECGRQVIGIESEEKYCELAAQRFARRSARAN